MKADALKARIKDIVKERNCTWNEVWKQLLLERLLARIASSPYHDKFTFKGGLLLAQYLTIGRETTDADFLMTQLKNDAASIEATFKKIAAIDLNDGFQFSWSDMEELNQPHMKYDGFRVSLDARLENMTDKIQIDIGVGDRVEAVKNKYRQCEYKGKPIFTGEITLLTYPVETIFSEKLETVISKGATNSRMKDYHDIILMSREPGLFKGELLKRAVEATFEHRGTAIKTSIAFDPPGIESLQKLWTQHLKGLGVIKDDLRLPEKIDDVIAEINSWLGKNLSL